MPKKNNAAQEVKGSLPIYISHYDLKIELDPVRTIVRSRLTCKKLADGPVRLSGEGLCLDMVMVDDTPIMPPAMLKRGDASTIKLHGAKDGSIIELLQHFDPSKKTSKLGIYYIKNENIFACDGGSNNFKSVTYSTAGHAATFNITISAADNLPHIICDGIHIADGIFLKTERHSVTYIIHNAILPNTLRFKAGTFPQSLIRPEETSAEILSPSVLAGGAPDAEIEKASLLTAYTQHKGVSVSNTDNKASKEGPVNEGENPLPVRRLHSLSFV